MTAQTKEVTTRENRDAVRSPRPEAETVFVPDVDILEDKDAIRLVADIPGVDRQSLNVTVENNVLTLEGAAQVDIPEGYDLVGQEYGIGRFRRDFTLSDQVDVDGIKARVQNGTLELTVPKREEVKAKRIKIAG